MTSATAWVRASALPGREALEVRFGELLEVQMDPGDAELLVCDLLAGLGQLYHRAGQWPDYLRLVGQFSDVLTREPGLQCGPDGGDGDAG